MFNSASPREILRFSGIKISCFPRDQLLSAYCLQLHCYMGRFYIINIRSLALFFSVVEALLHNASPRQCCEITIWNCSCSPKMCCRRLPSSSYNLVKKQLDSRQRLRDQQWKCFYSQPCFTYYKGRESYVHVCGNKCNGKILFQRSSVDVRRDTHYKVSINPKR